MAKIKVILISTLDGFLPPESDERFEWLRTDKHGLENWYGDSVRSLHPLIPLTDLIRIRKLTDRALAFQAEVTDGEGADLLKRLLVYRMVDEIVLYLFPITTSNGIRIMEGFETGEWKTVEVNHYRNGVCRMVYRKVLLQ